MREVEGGADELGGFAVFVLDDPAGGEVEGEQGAPFDVADSSAGQGLAEELGGRLRLPQQEVAFAGKPVQAVLVEEVGAAGRVGCRREVGVGAVERGEGVVVLAGGGQSAGV